MNTIPLDFNMSFTSSLCSCVIVVRFPRCTALSILWACAMLGLGVVSMNTWRAVGAYHITSHEQGRGRLSRSTGEWLGWTNEGQKRSVPGPDLRHKVYVPAGSRQRISLADYGCQELQELELSLPALDRGNAPLRKV